jgi:protoheme IX farnesyltransferase
MSTTAVAYTARRATILERLADYLELTKPRIATLVLVTVVVAAYIGNAGAPDGWLLVHTLLGTALVAASASALNQWWEQRTDLLMERTEKRPLPDGRLSSAEVLMFGIVTITVGSVYLSLAVNVLTASLGLLTWLIYVWIYTPLKTRTPLNTFVGAIAGALPVLMGWAAVGASFNLGVVGEKAAALFLIVFLWQFPHFMAIAWIYRKQYGAAGMKMLPVVDPSGRRAGAQSVITALLLLPVSIVPMALHAVGPVYFAGAIGLGLAYFVASCRFCVRPNEQTSRTLLRVSLVYLPALLLLMMFAPLPIFLN